MRPYFEFGWWKLDHCLIRIKIIKNQKPCGVFLILPNGDDEFIRIGKRKANKKRNSYRHLRTHKNQLPWKPEKKATMTNRKKTIVKYTDKNATSWNKCFGWMLMLPVFRKFIVFCHQVDDHYVINDRFLCHFYLYTTHHSYVFMPLQLEYILSNLDLHKTIVAFFIADKIFEHSLNDERNRAFCVELKFTIQSIYTLTNRTITKKYLNQKLRSEWWWPFNRNTWI